MEEKKCCRNCIHFPCTKNECDIKNNYSCKEFKSIIQSAIEIIEQCNKDS